MNIRYYETALPGEKASARDFLLLYEQVQRIERAVRTLISDPGNPHSAALIAERRLEAE